MANLSWDVLEITVSLIINYFDQGFCFLQSPTKVESKDLLSKSLDKRIPDIDTVPSHIPTQEHLPFLSRILSKSNPLGHSLPPSRPLWSKTTIWNEAHTTNFAVWSTRPSLPPGELETFIGVFDSLGSYLLPSMQVFSSHPSQKDAW